MKEDEETKHEKRWRPEFVELLDQLYEHPDNAVCMLATCHPISSRTPPPKTIVIDPFTQVVERVVKARATWI